MADIKNFGLKGVNADLQFGKNGGRLLWDGSQYKMTTDGSTLAPLHVLDDSNVNSAASKQYVDSVASGLDPKESVLYGTIADLAADDYTTGTFTNFATLIDNGSALAVDDRLLIKDQGDAKQNGIYAVDSVGTQAVVNNTIAETGGVLNAGQNAGIPDASITDGGTIYTAVPTVTITNDASGTGATATAILTAQVVTNIDVTAGGTGYNTGTTTITITGPTVASRADDHDGSPANEVSAGNFTFVEQGDTNADAGFVMQGTGDILLDTDDVVWVQFSGAGQITAGDGLAKSGNTIDLDFTSGLADVAVDSADLIAFADTGSGNAMESRSFAAVAVDLDFPIDIGGTGLVVATGAGTGSAVTLAVVADGVATGGLGIANADGTGGNPTFGLDFLSLTGVDTPNVLDTMVLSDASNAGINKSVTVQQIVDVVASQGSDNEISASANTTLVLTDTGVDGTMTFTADSTVALTIDDTTADFQGTAITTTAAITGAAITGSSFTDSGLTNTAVLYSTNGLIDADSDAFTYNSGSDTLAVPNLTGATVAMTGNISTSAGDVNVTLGDLNIDGSGKGITVDGGAIAGFITLTKGNITATLGDMILVEGNLTVSHANNGIDLNGTDSFITLDDGDINISGDGKGLTVNGNATDGFITLVKGDITATSGDIVASQGDIIITHTDGDLILNGDTSGISINGSTVGGFINMAKGDITLTAGDLLITTGNVAVTTGNISTASGTIRADDLGVVGAGVVYANATTGVLETEVGFTYSAGDNTLTLGTGSGGWSFDADTQTITGLATDTDIVIAPNGTGEVIIGSAGAATLASDTGEDMTLNGDKDLYLQSGSGDVYIQDWSTTTATTAARFSVGTAITDDEYLWFKAGATTPTIATINDTSITFDFGVNTTSSALIVGNSADYITAIDAIGDAALVTKGWVDAAISSGASEEAVKSMAVLLDLTDFSGSAGGTMPLSGGNPDPVGTTLFDDMIGTSGTAGSGYAVAPTVTQGAGGAGTGAVFTATINGSGVIITLTATGGNGAYTGAETLIIDANTASFDEVPAKATIMRITLDVSTASDSATSAIDFGTAASPELYADETASDLFVPGLYAMDIMAYSGSARTPIVTHGAVSGGSVGAAYAILEYRVPLSAELALE